MYVCIYTYIYTYIYICTYIHIYLHMCMLHVSHMSHMSHGEYINESCHIHEWFMSHINTYITHI